MGVSDLRQTDINLAFFQVNDLPKPFQSHLAARDAGQVRESGPLFPQDTMLPDTTNLRALFPRNFPTSSRPRRLAEFKEIDKNQAFPLPEFLEHLDEGRKDTFLKDREELFQCTILFDTIIVPAYLPGEKNNYSAQALSEWLSNNQRSPFTRNRFTREEMLNDFSPHSYAQYQELAEEARKLVRADLLDIASASALVSVPESGDVEPLAQGLNHLVGYLILDQHKLLSVSNVQSLLNNPSLFLASYKKLAALNLNQAAYLEILLKSTMSAQSFLDNPELFLKSYDQLVSLNLNQTVYLELVLAEPEALAVLCQYNDLFLKLSSLELNQEKYIKRLVDCPQELTLVQILLEQGLDAAIGGYQAQDQRGKANTVELLKIELNAVMDIKSAEDILKRAALYIDFTLSFAQTYTVKQYFEKTRKLLDIKDSDCKSFFYNRHENSKSKVFSEIEVKQPQGSQNDGQGRTRDLKDSDLTHSRDANSFHLAEVTRPLAIKNINNALKKAAENCTTRNSLAKLKIIEFFHKKIEPRGRRIEQEELKVILKNITCLLYRKSGFLASKSYEAAKKDLEIARGNLDISDKEWSEIFTTAYWTKVHASYQDSNLYMGESGASLYYDRYSSNSGAEEGASASLPPGNDQRYPKGGNDSQGGACGYG
ncbi:hypothetical protein ACGP04_04350 [Piscirickettsia salmonis]|uniref:hypothetical protein n=1 Tax=Piscirickettsia salmonis TaxID=1238 RepID=UPI0037532446